MNFDSPLKRHQKQEKVKIENIIEKPIEKFEPIKPVITKSDAKNFVGRTCDTQQLLWIERWLTHYVQQNSYPPSMKGPEAWSYINRFLRLHQIDELLTMIRKDFSQQYPLLEGFEQLLRENDFDFLKAEELSLEHQRKRLIDDHNTH